MCKKRNKAGIIAGNTEKKIGHLQKSGSSRSIKGDQRVPQKELKEAKKRRYWQEVRARQLLEQVAAD